MILRVVAAAEDASVDVCAVARRRLDDGRRGRRASALSMKPITRVCVRLAEYPVTPTRLQSLRSS